MSRSDFLSFCALGTNSTTMWSVAANTLSIFAKCIRNTGLFCALVPMSYTLQTRVSFTRFTQWVTDDEIDGNGLRGQEDLMVLLVERIRTSCTARDGLHWILFSPKRVSESFSMRLMRRRFSWCKGFGMKRNGFSPPLLTIFFLTDIIMRYAFAREDNRSAHKGTWLFDTVISFVNDLDFDPSFHDNFVAGVSCLNLLRHVSWLDRAARSLPMSVLSLFSSVIAQFWEEKQVRRLRIR